MLEVFNCALALLSGPVDIPASSSLHAPRCPGIFPWFYLRYLCFVCLDHFQTCQSCLRSLGLLQACKTSTRACSLTSPDWCVSVDFLCTSAQYYNGFGAESKVTCPTATRQTPRSGSACGKRQSKHEVPCLWVHMMALAAMCGNIFAFLSNNLRISMVSKYFESIPYRLNEETGLIDYDECEKFALRSAVKMRRIYHRATLGSIWGTVPVNCVTSCEPRLDCFPA